ncbi:MAG TPA: polyprenyl synthetase family protein [Capsulimonadaceae bacterium]|jgi:geranylgeranyl pyrophosphate synthase
MTTAAQENRLPSTKSVGTTETGFVTPIQADLQAVEDLLANEIRSDVRAAYEISGHTLKAGGKRLRPAAVILSARAVERAFPARTIYASAGAVELIHMASLIHDDVVDGADSRRGRPTANAAFGNQISVLVGDYLLAKSIYLAAREGNMDVITIFSKVTVGLSEGEVLQITSRGDADTSEATYFDIIRRKTAGFISGCCEIGAVLAEASPDVVDALTGYGLSLGLAFQIADDLLDFLGDPAVTGKPRCSDLREGKMTLPLIAAYRSLPDGSARKRDIASWVQDPDALSDDRARSICSLIDEYNGYEYARQSAVSLVDDAARQVESVLPPSIYRDSLISLANYALGRKF